METIAKLIRAILFDGESVNRTAISHLKDYMIGILIGFLLTCCGIWYIADDEESEEVSAGTEYVNEYDNA